MSSLADALIKFRERRGLTQKELASLIGITQVHVSRLESGARASEHLLTRIKKVLSGEEVSSRGYEFEVKQETFLNWEVSYIYHPTTTSGDRIHCHFEKLKNGHVLHCDAVGSDTRASHDADHLITAFEGVVNSLESFATPGLIYNSLNKTVKKNKGVWRDKPSAYLFTLHENSSRLEFVNAGMPSPYLLRSSGKILGEYRESHWPPIGGKKKQDRFDVDVLNLEPGDIFISFSDGFISNFNNFADIKLSKQIESLSRFQRGSSKGLLMRLMKNFGYNVQYRELNDDISCLMIRNLG